MIWRPIKRERKRISWLWLCVKDALYSWWSVKLDKINHLIRSHAYPDDWVKKNYFKTQGDTYFLYIRSSADVPRRWMWVFNYPEYLQKKNPAVRVNCCYDNLTFVYIIKSQNVTSKTVYANRVIFFDKKKREIVSQLSKPTNKRDGPRHHRKPLCLVSRQNRRNHFY